MLNLENWAWADCQLGNRAKRAQQFNLHGEKREWRKKGEEKERKKGEGREKRKGKGGKRPRKSNKRKNRKAKLKTCEKYFYIFRNSYSW